MPICPATQDVVVSRSPGRKAIHSLLLPTAFVNQVEKKTKRPNEFQTPPTSIITRVTAAAASALPDAFSRLAATGNVCQTKGQLSFIDVFAILNIFSTDLCLFDTRFLFSSSPPLDDVDHSSQVVNFYVAPAALTIHDDATARCLIFVLIASITVELSTTNTISTSLLSLATHTHKYIYI